MCIYLSRGYQIYANKIIYKANVKRNIYWYALFLLFQCLEPKRMTFVWLSKNTVNSWEMPPSPPKKCNIFYHFYLWKYSNKNIGNDGFLLAFFSFHSGWHICQDILYIQKVFRYCTRGFVHKSVNTCIINGPGVLKIEKGQGNISYFPLKILKCFLWNLKYHIDTRVILNLNYYCSWLVFSGLMARLSFA